MQKKKVTKRGKQHAKHGLHKGKTLNKLLWI